LMNSGKLRGEFHHAEIVLSRVQIRPGHDVGAAHDVFLKVLVNVPQKRNQCRRTHSICMVI
jgi:hypothetical protein